jgi:predicted transcriptional regulator
MKKAVNTEVKTELNHIEYKKPFYKIKSPLMDHLRTYSRLTDLPLKYEELLQYSDLIPMVDDMGEPTLWYSVIYRPSDLDYIEKALIHIYQLLMVDGDPIPYIKVASIEYCSFGNSKPFRIKVINEINDNHDYYYIKRADASRIYGLELEEIFSPDKVSFLVTGDTLIEEHIVGVPCDEFILKNKQVKIENRLRFAKEFVKFNERCFARLLGDMRGYNFVVEIIQDFDNVQYRMRPIDFDQQSYEGRKNMYLPQFYKDNIELVSLAQELFSPSIVDQYQKEERTVMRKRFLASKTRTRSLLRRMKKDKISSPEYMKSLAKELDDHHNTEEFLSLQSMGDILALHLEKKLNISIFS